MKKFATAFALTLLSAAWAAPSQAACNAACNEARAIWKTKEAVKIDGDTYYVAIAPQNAYALVGWKKSVKAFTVENVDTAVQSVSSCRSIDLEGYGRLQAAKGGEIPTRIFRSSKHIRFGLKC